MKLSINWLKDFTDVTDIPLKDYCDRMTDTGSKVESFCALAESIENVVVGRIESITPHPDSDHLLVCSVNCGEGENRQIVTGAQNIFEGAVVPVAKAPARLPKDVVIKSGKLRGVDSCGMLCSIGELDLTTHEFPGVFEDGIFILNDVIDKAGELIGTDIRDVLLLNDSVVDFEITSNRPDCLSVIGLARESAVSFDRPFSLKKPVVTEHGADISDYLSVEVEDGALCRRYAARVVTDIKIEPSPLWMRMRLYAAGVRPINNIVDITNYVMLEYGQPMHAFDYSMLDGGRIVVRKAADGEVFRALDDSEHVLDKNTLVIADEKKAVALAGIMGGANSEIKDSTRTVVFESANFDGATVRIAAKAQGMRTESSSRFEKGLDPENVMPALDRACELVALLGAGKVSRGCVDVYKGRQPCVAIPFESGRINAFLGVSLSKEYMAQTLEKLGCSISDDKIIPPSFRADLSTMNDIAEEVIRIYGYNRIESTPFRCNVKAGLLTPRQAFRERIHRLLTGMGANECMTFSFVSPSTLDKIALPADCAERRTVKISNPLGEDTSVIRTSRIPSLMDVLSRNNNYHSEDACMYELAYVYIPNEDPELLPEEHTMLALGFYGKGDFYDLKGMVENILCCAGIKNVKYISSPSDPTFHPGRCASVSARGGAANLGVFGQIHPKVAGNYGFSREVYVAYLDFDLIFGISNLKKQYKPLPKYPAITRDFSFICPKDMESACFEDIMRKAAGALCEGVELFDTYTGDKMPPDSKSVAFRVLLRAQDHTLTLEEADKVCTKILAAVEKSLGISLKKA